MTTWGKQYGVRDPKNGGHHRWFTDYNEAVAFENAILYPRLKDRLATGERVILTTDIAQRMGLDPQ